MKSTEKPCEQCGIGSNELTPVALYFPKQVLLNLCGECYEQALAENKHIHPDNRISG